MKNLILGLAVWGVVRLFDMPNLLLLRLRQRMLTVATYFLSAALLIYLQSRYHWQFTPEVR